MKGGKNVKLLFVLENQNQRTGKGGLVTQRIKNILMNIFFEYKVIFFTCY